MNAEVQTGPLGPQARAVLEAFARALDREAHVLAEHPGLTLQQLHNRLQWEGDAVEARLTPQRERHAAGARVWLRTRTPFQESEALIRTLTGHTDKVYDCTVSPDGRRIISASTDNTLKVWDAESGAELLTLVGHTRWVPACAFSPDGRRIISGCGGRVEGGTLKVWDAESGEALATLSLPHGLKSVAAHPWLPLAVCGDWAGGLYRVELMGLEYGPIVVIAAGRDDCVTIRCPACWQERALEPRRLGSETTCPTPGCGLSLRVNPFVLSQARPKSGWSSSLWGRLR